MKPWEIWTPDIVILNSVEENYLEDNRDNFLIKISHNGIIRWQYQIFSKSFCQIDILAFPFDEQLCRIEIGSSALEIKSLNLKKRNARVKVQEKINTEWFLVSSLVEHKTIGLNSFGNSSTREYASLIFNLRIRRVVTYYVFKIVFPFTFIAFTTLFAFLLTPDSGEKIALEVSILLSLVLYLQYLSEYIPRSTTSNILFIASKYNKFNLLCYLKKACQY